MTSRTENRRVLASWWHLARKRPRLLAGITLFTVIFVGADVILPIWSGRFIDAIAGVGFQQGDRAAQFAAAGVAIVLFIGTDLVFTVAHWCASRLLVAFETTSMRDLMLHGFEHIQAMDSAWHANTHAGATVRKVTRGKDAFEHITDAIVMGLAPALLVVTGMSLMLTLHWPLMGLYTFVATLAHIAVSLLLVTRYNAPVNSRAAVEDSRLSGHLVDAVTCNSVVKAFGAERREARRLVGLSRVWRGYTVRSWNRMVDTGSIQIGLMILMEGGGLVLVTILWWQGRATVGDVVLVLNAFGIISAYVRELGNHVRTLQQALNDMEEVVDLAAQVPAVRNRPGAPDLVVTAGAVTFEGVTFAHGGAEGRVSVFQALSVSIRAGERVALVGPSGAGKSTFVKLLQRLHDLDGGRICIDGQDITAVTQASLRAAIALVPQDPVLFHRSILENIRYARPGATRADVAAAAERAHALDFIARLPNGFDTVVGERGVKLSGGERQRVAIARAILADAPILVLDEATAALDSVSEREIQAALETVTRGRTSVIVAHRLSTIRQADRILVFDRGRIVEHGRHADLVARPGGVYRRLFETQALGLVDQGSEVVPSGARA